MWLRGSGTTRFWHLYDSRPTKITYFSGKPTLPQQACISSRPAVSQHPRPWPIQIDLSMKVCKPVIHGSGSHSMFYGKTLNLFSFFSPLMKCIHRLINSICDGKIISMPHPYACTFTTEVMFYSLTFLNRSFCGTWWKGLANGQRSTN